MKKKQNLLIINKAQFGHLTDAIKWCEYLKDYYNITFLCFDSLNERTEIPGVKVKYINYSGSYKTRGYRFVIAALWHILFFNGKILVEYFEKCKILKQLMPWKRMLLDVRTIAVWGDKAERDRYDNAISQTCRFYDHITVISTGVKERLGLSTNNNVSILPLGSDCISSVKKEYNNLRLLYVGTFNGRNIDKTVKGFFLFKSKRPESNMKYDIIGYGKPDEVEKIKSAIKKYDLEDSIAFHGSVKHDMLSPYFDTCNIGVSFIPITDFYNVQPPTKTFEYALSGLYSIATATDENKKIITQTNGILITDSSEDFARALEYVEQNKKTFDCDKIKCSLMEYSWKAIVTTKLLPILNKI